MKNLLDDRAFISYIETIGIDKILKESGTPLFIYDGDIISDRYSYLLESIDYPHKRVFYAMKANYNPAVLKHLESTGSSIDAVSPAEVFLALECGFTPDRIMFTANNITDEEMDEVASTGVLFNIDSLSRLKKFGSAYPGREVCLRINTDIVAGEHRHIQTAGTETKFGIPADRVREAASIASSQGLKVTGLHKHTGSGIADKEKFLKSMENLVSFAEPDIFPHLEFIDFGGGYKAPYHPEEKTVDYEDFGTRAGQLFRNFCQKYGRELFMYIEPGKFIVSQCGTFLVRVNTLKENRGRQIAGVDSGFPHLIRPLLYEAYHHMVNISNPGGKKTRYDVCGNICESGDCFARDREISEIREGDILAILNAGAYCYSMASVYNLRPLPSEIFIKGKEFKVLSRRKSSRELAQEIFRSSEA